jgi:hypothetical protein
MPRFRSSLLALFGFVTVVAVGCAALVNPTDIWAIAVVTSTVAILTFGVLAAIFGFGETRAFWSGFSIVGWGHIVLSLILDGTYLGSHLATLRVLEAAFEQQIESTGMLGNTTLIAPDEHAMSIGIALWSLLLGFLAGLVARHLYLWRERQSTSKPPSG